MRAISIVMVSCAFCAAVLGCGADDTPAPATPAGAAPAEPQTFAEQVTAGQKLFGENCASCHGAAGEGTPKGPALVGLDKGALPLDPPPGAKFRKTQFRTLADVAEFAVKNMPADRPGSLKEWEYWSIVAFDLKANGVSSDKKMDGAVAKTIVLHP